MRCDNNESLGRQIYLAAQEIKNFAEKLLKPYELTIEQFHILKQLSQDSGLTQSELGGMVNKTPANITRILDRLEAKNLVVRQNSKKDRRATFVFLTDHGNTLIDEVFTTFESFSAQLTQGISSGDQQKTGEILDTIGSNIKNMSQNFHLSTTTKR